MREERVGEVRCEEWNGVRWPMAKSDVRREQEKAGVWVDAGTEIPIP